MTRVLAVEWDHREVRLVSGNVGSSVTIDHALSHNFPSNSSDATVDPSVVAPIIRELASKAGHTSGDIIVAVGRGQIELRSFIVPKADRNELPDMVRFTAIRHFANVGDTWPIDFVTLPRSSSAENGEAAKVQEVNAATINPSLISQIKRICTEAGFNLKQLGVRPLASGTLGAESSKSPISKDATVLLIGMLADEAEMVVLEKGNVSFMRTVRLAVSEEQPVGVLSVGEIRRTLIAAMNARPGLEVQRVILWGRNPQVANALSDWEKNLNLPVEVVDPFSLVDAKKSAEHLTDTGKFASLLGLLHQYRPSTKSYPSKTTIDLLHPRQRQEKPKPIRQYALAAIAASTLIGGGYWWYSSTHQKLDAEIARLTKNVKDMEPNVKLSKQNTTNWLKIEKYLQGDIQWLDELAYLSERALPPEQMIFRDTSITLTPMSNQGKISSHVDIIDQDFVPQLEEKLRDDSHQVGSKEIRPGNDKNNIYGWSVDPEILISPRLVADPMTLPPPKRKEVEAENKEAEAASKGAEPSKEVVVEETKPDSKQPDEADKKLSDQKVDPSTQPVDPKEKEAPPTPSPSSGKVGE
jgi:Tfp pilus assembly PilM family ATPase